MKSKKKKKKSKKLKKSLHLCDKVITKQNSFEKNKFLKGLKHLFGSTNSKSSDDCLERTVNKVNAKKLAKVKKQEERKNNLASTLTSSDMSNRKEQRTKLNYRNTEFGYEDESAPRKKQKRKKSKYTENTESEYKEENILNEEKKKKKLKHNEDMKSEHRNEDTLDKGKRTVFVGNIPTSISKKEIKLFFKACGNIESLRIRCAAPVKSSIPKKVAVIKNMYHPESSSYNAYLVFKTEEMALSALKLNGTEINNHHIRVDLAQRTEHDHKKSIFVGNLPFNIKDDELWEFFKECGDIGGVHIIKDRSTRIGKGFGYILFKKLDSIPLALEMNGKELRGRPLRISLCTSGNRKNMNTKSKQKRNRQRSDDNSGGNFQGTFSTEKQKVLKKKKQIKQRTNEKRKKALAQKLQSKIMKN